MIPPTHHPPNVYTIQLDNGTTIEQSYEQVVSTQLTSHTAAPSAASDAARVSGIPACFQHNAKVTLDHEGSFHKGFISYSETAGFHFVVRRNLRSTKVDWSTPLHDFKRNWVALCQDDILVPGHTTVSSFLKTATSNTAPSLNFVSAKNMFGPCPPSLVKALHPSNPDRRIWLDSYNEEKGGLQDMGVYERISKKDYLSLKRAGKIPKAIPSMCVLVVKTDRDGKPNRAKSRIVVLGNHEDRLYSKSKRYAPVLKYDSLRLLTAHVVSNKRILQQGDCKNAFCNATLPDDEATVIRPPAGDPAHKQDEYWLLKKTLYGLRRSPKHWYNMITRILQSMGLEASRHDPCLYSGIINADDTSSPSAARQKIHVGLYVDDFVFFSTSPEEEELFRKELAANIKVDFMGDVDYFLGSAFTWKRLPDGHISVHLCQSAFTEFTSQRFGVDKMNPVPNMTPYRSGYPIDAIPPSDPHDPDLKRRTKIYQQIIGSINWLAQCTRPDVAPALTFLSSYNLAPHHQHYKAAIHVLKYLHSTAEYGISYHSDACNTIQAFNHFPHHHDKEAFKDATAPAPSECHELTAYSDACWGGNFGNVVPDGTPLEPFKFRSLSGYLVCMCGGPIAWKSIRQDQTALSSCEAEILATNECVKDLDSVKLRAHDLGAIPNNSCTTVYNDNQAAVNWSASCTTKGIKHLNLRENMVRERHHAGDVMVVHIPGIINPSDIFTKEMKDATHYRRLCDCMMVSKSAFLKHNRPVPTTLATSERILPYYSLRSQLPPPSPKPTAQPKTQPASQPLSRRVSTGASTSVSESPERHPTFFSRDHVTGGC